MDFKKLYAESRRYSPDLRQIYLDQLIEQGINFVKSPKQGKFWSVEIKNADKKAAYLVLEKLLQEVADFTDFQFMLTDVVHGLKVKPSNTKEIRTPYKSGVVQHGLTFTFDSAKKPESYQAAMKALGFDISYASGDTCEWKKGIFRCRLEIWSWSGGKTSSGLMGTLRLQELSQILNKLPGSIKQPV